MEAYGEVPPPSSRSICFRNGRLRSVYQLWCRLQMNRVVSTCSARQSLDARLTNILFPQTIEREIHNIVPEIEAIALLKRTCI